MNQKKLNFGGGLSKFTISFSALLIIATLVLCLYGINLENYAKSNPEAELGGFFLFLFGWIPLGILTLICLILGIVEWLHRGCKFAGLAGIGSVLIYLLAWVVVGVMVPALTTSRSDSSLPGLISTSSTSFIEGDLANHDRDKSQISTKYSPLLPRPDAPLLLFNTSESIITIEWDMLPSEDVKSFNIYRALWPEGPWLKVFSEFPADVPRALRIATDSYFPKNVENLYYKVSSVDDEGGEGLPSEPSRIAIDETFWWWIDDYSPLGFSFRHPKEECRIVEHEPGRFCNFSIECGIFSIFVREINSGAYLGNLSLLPTHKEFTDFLYKLDGFDENSMQILSEEKTQLNGLPASKIKYRTIEGEEGSWIYVLLTGSRALRSQDTILKISYLTKHKKYGEFSLDYLQQAEKIINTFKFLVVDEDNDVIQVYLNHLESGEACSCTVPVLRRVPAFETTEETVKVALQRLSEGSTALEAEEGYIDCLPSPEIASEAKLEWKNDYGEAVGVKSVEIKSATAYIDFSKEMRSYGGLGCWAKSIYSSVLYTVLQFSGINNVKITIEGQEESALRF